MNRWLQVITGVKFNRKADTQGDYEWRTFPIWGLEWDSYLLPSGCRGPILPLSHYASNLALLFLHFYFLSCIQCTVCDWVSWRLFHITKHHNLHWGILPAVCVGYLGPALCHHFSLEILTSGKEKQIWGAHEAKILFHISVLTGVWTSDLAVWWLQTKDVKQLPENRLSVYKRITGSSFSGNDNRIYLFTILLQRKLHYDDKQCHKTWIFL